MAKPAALKAIARTLVLLSKRPELPDSAPWLLERVRAYARTREGEDAKFTPYPASWFNAGHYDDDFAALTPAPRHGTPSPAARREPDTAPGDSPASTAHPMPADFPTFAETRDEFRAGPGSFGSWRGVWGKCGWARDSYETWKTSRPSAAADTPRA